MLLGTTRVRQWVALTILGARPAAAPTAWPPRWSGPGWLRAAGTRPRLRATRSSRSPPGCCPPSTCCWASRWASWRDPRHRQAAQGGGDPPRRAGRPLVAEVARLPGAARTADRTPRSAPPTSTRQPRRRSPGRCPSCQRRHRLTPTGRRLRTRPAGSALPDPRHRSAASSSLSKAPAAIGRPRCQPCTRSQPRSRRMRERAAASSTPSATIRSPSAWVRSTVERTIATARTSSTRCARERPVQLDLVDGQLEEVLQRAVAGAVVVDRELDAELGQRVHHAPRGLGSRIIAVSVISMVSAVRRHAVLEQRGGDDVHEGLVAQVRGGHVHRDAAGRLPAARQRARSARATSSTRCGDGGGEPVALGDVEELRRAPSRPRSGGPSAPAPRRPTSAPAAVMIGWYSTVSSSRSSAAYRSSATSSRLRRSPHRRRASGSTPARRRSSRHTSRRRRRTACRRGFAACIGRERDPDAGTHVQRHVAQHDRLRKALLQRAAAGHGGVRGCRPRAAPPRTRRRPAGRAGAGSAAARARRRTG